MQVLPDPDLLSVGQAPLARHPAAAELGRQHLPRDAALEHEQDASERQPIADGFAPRMREPARWPGRKQWRDQCPQIIIQQGLGHDALAKSRESPA